MGCLYSLTSPSGKSYLGITLKSVEKRFAKHVEHALGKRENGVLYSALRKYSPETFKVESLVIANDWAYLCDLEKKAIVAFGSRYPSGYNMTDGGEGIQGKRDEKARRAISVAQRKRFERPEERLKAKLAGEKGRAAKAAKRKPGPAPWVERKRAAHARNGSQEHRLKISLATKAAMQRPEVQAKMRIPRKKKLW